MLVGILDAPIPTELPPNASGKAAADDQILGSLLPTWETRTEFLASGFHWLSPGCCDHLRSEPGNGKYSVTQPFK